jgi:hypothetical protein
MIQIVLHREYLIIYRGPGFIADNLAPPSPPTPSPGSKLDKRYIGRLRKRENLLTGEGRGGRRIAESIIRPKERLVLYKSFNTLWSYILLLICLVQYSKLHSPIASNSATPRGDRLTYLREFLFFLFDSCPR